MKLLSNGAVVDDERRIIVRFVYADRELEEYLVSCLRARENGTGEAAVLREIITGHAKLWDERGKDVIAMGKSADDPRYIGEGTGMRNCAAALNKAYERRNG